MGVRVRIRIEFRDRSLVTIALVNRQGEWLFQRSGETLLKNGE